MPGEDRVLPPFGPDGIQRRVGTFFLGSRASRKPLRASAVTVLEPILDPTLPKPLLSDTTRWHHEPQTVPLPSDANCSKMRSPL